MGIKNWIMGVATVTTMAGVAKAEPKVLPDASSENVENVTIKDVSLTDNNVYNTSNEFVELRGLNEALKSPTNLQPQDMKEINSWIKRITEHPGDKLSREAFKKIKAEALKTTNIFVMVDQYYTYTYMEEGNVDQLIRSQKFLHRAMDKVISNENVRNNIPEAKVSNSVLKIAENFAKLRFYEQAETYRFLQNHPEKLEPYYKALKGNKKEQEIAKYMEINFYKRYGLNISPEYTYLEGNGEERRYMEYVYLCDNEVKKDVYRDCFFASLDDAFKYNPTMHLAKKHEGKVYSIPNQVAKFFRNYARTYAHHKQGEKIGKDQLEALDDVPVEITRMIDAYLKRNFDEFCRLKDLPADEKNIKFISTTGEIDDVWSEYIKLSRVEYPTILNMEDMQKLQMRNPLLKEAEEYYRVHKLLSENSNGSNNIMLAKNMSKVR